MGPYGPIWVRAWAGPRTQALHYGRNFVQQTWSWTKKELCHKHINKKDIH